MIVHILILPVLPAASRNAPTASSVGRKPPPAAAVTTASHPIQVVPRDTRHQHREVPQLPAPRGQPAITVSTVTASSAATSAIQLIAPPPADRPPRAGRSWRP